MSIVEKVKEHWVTGTLYVLFSLFFLWACLVSANTYGAIAQAQRDVCLQNADFDAEIVTKGHLNISFAVQLNNPSRYELHVYALSWYAKLENLSSQNSQVIPVGEKYVGPTQYLEVPAKTTVNYSMWSIVSDPETLSKLFGFINYSKGLGEDYTLETLPYVHDFSIMLMIGSFEHEYLREGYLNDLVTVRLTYSSETGLP
ncbi:MAG: hypothetical protein ACUVT7_02455 [Thermoplasmata archaeon]